MAILSTFYDTSAGTPASLVTEVKWSAAHPYIGASEYGVVSPGDFMVLAHPSTPYAVNVTPGQAWGRGVFDDSSDFETVQCATPASGTTRWDLIALRRDWTPSAGGPSSLVAVAGGTSKALPAGRQNDPGTRDDQPLYLVQWKAGQTQPQAIVDLRCWAGNGGMIAKDDLVRSYLTTPGTRIDINGVQWALRIDNNAMSYWDNSAQAKVVVAGASGRQWAISGETSLTTNKYGVGFINFPERFPNEIRALLVQDTTLIPGSGIENKGVVCKPMVSKSTVSQGQFIAFSADSGAALPNQAMYVTYIAGGA